MKKRNESKTTLIIDEPQWVIRTDKASSRTFNVAVGNKFLDSEVLPLSVTEQELQLYRDKGFKILQVPFGYYEQFLDDIDIALTDIAGISTVNALKYISGIRWNEIKNKDYINPFNKDVIEVGNASDDLTQYSDYFNIDIIPNDLKAKPLFIHLDMSTSGDKTGIAGIWIVGKKASVEGQSSSKELFYKLAFSVSIKAPKGYQISFEKNRTFIRWLREQGFNIKHISSDTFQSAQIQQQLKAEGFNCSILSVDRVDKDSICKPYQYLKNTVYEHRIEMYESKKLFDEFVDVERNMNTGKVDHSPNGSKDVLDAVCGATFTASKYAEEYAYDYGETFNMLMDFNQESGQEAVKQQMVVDMEEELRKIGQNILGSQSQSEHKEEKKQDNNWFYNDMLYW